MSTLVGEPGPRDDRTGKRAQTPRDFLLGHKAALIAAA
jgi:hypothetical protein